MKKTLLFPAILTLASVFGCGGNKDQTADSGASAVVSANSAVITPAEPKEVVRVFLEAMRVGNGDQLAALFSANARAEIQKQGIKIEPPGSAQATFVIDAVANNGDAVFVSSLWKEPPTVPGEDVHEMEVVWQLCKEAAGWRVCGMAVDPGTGEDLEVVNFEKLDEPAVGAAPANQTRMASLPQGNPNGVSAQAGNGFGDPSRLQPQMQPSGMPTGMPTGTPTGMPNGMPQSNVYPQSGGLPQNLPQNGQLPNGLPLNNSLPQSTLPQGSTPMGNPSSGNNLGLPGSR